MRTIVLAGLLIACGSPPPAPRPVPPAPRPAPAKPAKAMFPGTPATPSGDQLAWVLDAIIKRHGKLERAELEAHFHPSFLAQIPADKALEIFGQMSTQLADLAIVDVQSE